MKFLALSPLAATLLAVITAGALIASYFLKLRHRRVMIASSMLWTRVLDRHAERSLWEKLRRLLSIILAVSIGLLMAFALARPEIAALSGTAGRVMIVLDTSPSMLARMADGRTRWQHAVERARSIVDAASVGAEFRIAGTAAPFDSPFTSDIHVVRQALDAMRPVTSTPRFPESDDTVETYFISDGVANLPAPGNARKLLVYEAARNVGITAFEVRSNPSKPMAYEAYVEVTNFGAETRKVAIKITEGGRGQITREREIPPGRSDAAILDLAAFEGGGMRAAVQSDGDALAADDVAYTYLPLRKKTRVLLVTKGNAYLQAALKLDSFVDLSVTDPMAYHDDPAIDAYVFDGFAPPVQPAKPALILGAQNVPWLPRANGTLERPSFTVWSDDHPAMQFLSLHDVSIARATAVDTSNVLLLARSGTAPLIVSSQKGAGARWIMTTFDLQASDFPFHDSFPLFVDNALAWFGRERLALQRTSGSVDIPLADAQIMGPDGKPVKAHAYLDHTIFEASEPGVYVAIKDGVRQHIAVNAMTRQYSNINHPPLNWKPVDSAPRYLLKDELWLYLLFFAVILLGFEWWTYHRRITV